MNAISTLTNHELNLKIQVLVREERKLTVEVLRFLRETERRMLFAELGYPSLFAYCTGELGYSEAAASRRIEAMRAMRETAELEPKLESGELSLSAVAQARVAIRAHERETKTKVSVERKRSVILSLSGLSKRKAEQTLAVEFPLTIRPQPVSVKSMADGATRITIELSPEEDAVISELKRIGGLPQNTKDLLMALARKELAKKRRERGEDKPLRRPSEKSAELSDKQGLGCNSTPPAESENNRRSFSAVVKRTAWLAAKGQCEFVGTNGRRCEARHALEYDHIRCIAHGGKSGPENIRVLCRQHNVLSAVRQIGRPTMARYLPTLEI